MAPDVVLIFAWVGAYLTILAAVFAVLLGADRLIRLLRNRKATR